MSTKKKTVINRLEQQGSGLAETIKNGLNKTLNTISKMIPNNGQVRDLYPDEFHIPGHNYTGPGTQLDKPALINKNPSGLLVRDFPPANEVDNIARDHDLEYDRIKKLLDSGQISREEAFNLIQQADLKMVEELQQPHIKNKYGAQIAKTIIGLKADVERVLGHNLYGSGEIKKYKNSLVKLYNKKTKTTKTKKQNKLSLDLFPPTIIETMPSITKNTIKIPIQQKEFKSIGNTVLITPDPIPESIANNLVIETKNKKKPKAVIQKESKPMKISLAKSKRSKTQKQTPIYMNSTDGSLIKDYQQMLEEEKLRLLNPSLNMDNMRSIARQQAQQLQYNNQALYNKNLTYEQERKKEEQKNISSLKPPAVVFKPIPPPLSIENKINNPLQPENTIKNPDEEEEEEEEEENKNPNPISMDIIDIEAQNYDWEMLTKNEIMKLTKSSMENYKSVQSNKSISEALSLFDEIELNAVTNNIGLGNSHLDAIIAYNHANTQHDGYFVKIHEDAAKQNGYVKSRYQLFDRSLKDAVNIVKNVKHEDKERQKHIQSLFNNPSKTTLISQGLLSYLKWKQAKDENKLDFLSEIPTPNVHITTLLEILNDDGKKTKTVNVFNILKSVATTKYIPSNASTVGKNNKFTRALQKFIDIDYLRKIQKEMLNDVSLNDIETGTYQDMQAVLNENDNIDACAGVPYIWSRLIKKLNNLASDKDMQDLGILELLDQLKEYGMFVMSVNNEYEVVDPFDYIVSRYKETINSSNPVIGSGMNNKQHELDKLPTQVKDFLINMASYLYHIQEQKNNKGGCVECTTSTTTSTKTQTTNSLKPKRKVSAKTLEILAKGRAIRKQNLEMKQQL